MRDELTIPEKQPFLLVVAGPNGSGKTTLTSHLRELGYDFGEYINPDDIAPRLRGSAEKRSLEAQRIADDLRAACLRELRSFSFETVMSHPSKVEVMRMAKSAGYRVVLYFVGTIDPAVNIARVAARVRDGGHDVPIDRIASRYHRTMSLLPEAVLAADASFIFDNSRQGTPTRLRRARASTGRAPRPVAEVRNVVNEAADPPNFTTFVRLIANAPDWVGRHLVLPVATVHAQRAAIVGRSTSALTFEVVSQL